MKNNQSTLHAVLTTAAATAVGALATGLTVRALVRAKRRIDLAGKAVLITGGSRGLGLVIARQFADAGARVAICSRYDDDLTAARLDIAQHAKGEVIALHCDVTDPEQLRKTVDEVAERFGRLDILVNNAAVIQVGPAQHMTIADYQACMDTTFWAALHATNAALPHFRRQGGGRVANVASIGGKIATPHLLPYSSAKFALVGLGEGMRAEFLAENIYVTTICPGAIATGSPLNATYKGRAAEEYAWFATGDVSAVQAASAERVARKLIDAVVHGDAEVSLPLAATLPILLHGIAPGVTAELMALFNRTLPKPGGRGANGAKGKDVAGQEPEWATDRTRAVGKANNEI